MKKQDKKKIIPIIIFNGRPGAGKSEVIDFLKSIPLKKRIEKYKIGKILEIDDFKFIMDYGKSDDKREKQAKKRLYTKKDNQGKYSVTVDNLYIKLMRDVNRRYKELKQKYDLKKYTVFIEFSRGGENAYYNSYNKLLNEILSKSVIYYVKVSYKESLRKNIKRYDPDKKDSILYHKVPEEVMKKYRKDDWFVLFDKKKKIIKIKSFFIKSNFFNNEDEKTLKQDLIEKELDRTLLKILKNERRIK